MAIQSQQTISDHIRLLANLVDPTFSGQKGHCERFGKQAVCVTTKTAEHRTLSGAMSRMSGVCH